MGFVPYIMPGFDLAKAAADVFEADPSVEGLILDKHGIFTFGDDAREAYDRMIARSPRPRTSAAQRASRRAPAPRCRPSSASRPTIAPLAARRRAVPRGEGRFDRMISDFRSSDAIARLSSIGAELADYAGRGVSTPDLSIRIKTGPLVAAARRTPTSSADYKAAVQEAVARFATDYRAYFETNDALRRRQAHHARPDAARSPGAGARHVRPSAAR